MTTLELSLKKDNIILTCYSESCFLFYNGCTITVVFGVQASILDATTGLDKLCTGRRLIISLSYLPVFKVESLEVNKSGSKVLLNGNRGLAVVNLPKDLWAKRTSHDDYREEYFCRCEQINDSVFSINSGLKCLKAKWHPGSENDSHIVSLCSDGILRLYDVSDPSSYKMTRKINLNSTLNASLDGSQIVKFDSVPFAVSFDFGPASNRDEIFVLYPIFIATRNGVIYCLSIDMNRFKCPNSIGPLNSIAAENSDALISDLICLSNSPIPVLCLVTSAGLLYHLVILENDTNLDENEVDYELLIYDCIQIELKLSRVDLETGIQTGQDNSRDDNLKLIKDSRNKYRYLVTSMSGVYSVDVGYWIRDLFNASTVFPSSDVKNRPSIIDFRFCTKFDGQNCNRNLQKCSDFVVSTTIFADDMGENVSYLLVSLNSGQVFVDKIKNSTYENIFPIVSKEVKIEHSNETLEMVRSILTKKSSIPIFRSSEILTEKQSAELFLRAVQTFATMLARQNEAKDFLENRAKLLLRQKSEQNSQLFDFDSRLAILIEQCTSLKEKNCHTIKKTRHLKNRLLIVIDRLNHQRGPLSLMEQEMMSNLEKMSIGYKTMNNETKKLMSDTKHAMKMKEIANKKQQITPREIVIEKSQDSVEKLVGNLRSMQDELKWLEKIVESV